jgi:hypothetical protein
LGVSRQGEFKNTTNIFWQKVRVENFFQNFDKNFDVSFLSTFFVLSHFRVFFSDGSPKTLQKTFYKKHRVEKFLQKIRPKVQNQIFLELFFITFLGVSRRGEFKNTIKKISEKNVDPSPFLASDPPTHPQGSPILFLLAAPWCTGGLLGWAVCIGGQEYRHVQGMVGGHIVPMDGMPTTEKSAHSKTHRITTWSSSRIF